MKKEPLLKKYLVSVDVAFDRTVAVIASDEANAEALAMQRVAYTSGYPVDNMSVYKIERVEE
jgi:hypothetical protein